MTNQPYNGISMLTSAYLICVGAAAISITLAVNVTMITEQMLTTMVTFSDLFDNYYASYRYSTFHYSKWILVAWHLRVVIVEDMFTIAIW